MSNAGLLYIDDKAEPIKSVSEADHSPYKPRLPLYLLPLAYLNFQIPAALPNCD